MNVEQQPERPITDTERLDWIVRHHYEFRAIYFRLQAPPDRLLEETRKWIDEEIRRQKA